MPFNLINNSKFYQIRIKIDNTYNVLKWFLNLSFLFDRVRRRRPYLRWWLGFFFSLTKPITFSVIDRIRAIVVGRRNKWRSRAPRPPVGGRFSQILVLDRFFMIFFCSFRWVFGGPVKSLRRRWRRRKWPTPPSAAERRRTRRRRCRRRRAPPPRRSRWPSSRRDALRRRAPSPSTVNHFFLIYLKK